MKHLFLVGRIASVIGLLAILYLSLVPGPMRPHVLDSGGSEHFTAYFLEALVATFSLWRVGRAILATTGLVVVSALCEMAQVFIPGRGPGVDGFLYSSAGALAAFLLFLAIRRRASVLFAR